MDTLFICSVLRRYIFREQNRIYQTVVIRIEFGFTRGCFYAVYDWSIFPYHPIEPKKGKRIT